MIGKIEELYIQTRNHPICHHLIPVESVLAYPVPVLHGDQVYLRFLVYRRGLTPREGTRPVYRPHAQLSIEYPSGRLVEYLDLRYANGAPASPIADPIGQYPHPAAGGLSFGEMVAQRTAFFDIIEEIITIIQKSEPSPEDKLALKRFRELFMLLVEPGLVPHYQALNPDFFEWVGG